MNFFLNFLTIFISPLPLGIEKLINFLLILFKSRFKADKTEVYTEKVKARRDEVLKKSQAELETWIDTNIQDMDDVRSYLKRLSRAVKVLTEFD